MMAGLYLLFVLDMVLIWLGMRKPAIALAFVTLALCMVMLWHHATSLLEILL